MGGPTNEDNRSKLTGEDAKEIRERYAAGGVSYAGLAEQEPATMMETSHIVAGEAVLAILPGERWAE